MSDHSTAADGRGPSAIRSVDRAVSVLEILARDGSSGVTEIARELDVHKSTVSRLVGTLESRGLVVQHASTQKYRLGFAVARLAAGVRGEVDLAEAARGVCADLSEHLAETVNLAVLEDDEVISVEQVTLSSSLITTDWVGQRHPLHATASGKVFLAFGPDELRERVLRGRLVPYTRRTIATLPELRAHLDAIRAAGHATTLGELERGLHSAAAPVRDGDGQVVAAIVVSGPEYRLPKDSLDAVGRQVRDAADAVSLRLGWLGDRS